MSEHTWALVEMTAGLLAPEEREVVLGDLREADENVLWALVDVFGLFLCRFGVLWTDWRPWLAGFGVALPSCYLLMGVSASVTCTFLRLMDPAVGHWYWPTGHEGVSLLLCHILLLLAWSWTAGFAVGSMSRRTVWVSVGLCLLPLSRACFPIEPLPRLCLFLFLFPAAVGILHGLRGIRLERVMWGALAVVATVLMYVAWSNQALWIYNWALISPAWYIVASARRSAPVVQDGLSLS
jgi:hypothetical protein